MSWQDAAACNGKPADWFFPENKGPGTSTAAKAVCAVCPVCKPCLAHALEHHEPGIWGGTTSDERRRIRAGKPPTRLGPRLTVRECQVCGTSFEGAAGRKTCDTCREKVRRETWRSSRQRLRSVS